MTKSVDITIHEKPSDQDSERFLVGVLMLYPPDEQDNIRPVITGLSPNLFYNPVHQALFSVVRGMYSRCEAVDIMSVGEQIKREGLIEQCGGAGFWKGLAETWGWRTSQVMSLIAILKNRAMRRGLIDASLRIIDDADDDQVDPFDTVNALQVRLKTLQDENSNGYIDTTSIIQALEARRVAIAEGRAGFYATGIRELDSLMNGGLPVGYPSVIKGDKGKGKTALTLQVLDQIVNQGGKVLLISLEMRREDVWARVVACRLYRAGLVDDTFNYTCIWNTASWMTKNPHCKPLEDYTEGWYIEDSEAMTPAKIFQVIEHHVKTYGVKIVAIDHLNLVTFRQGATVQDREQFVEGLRGLAKKRDIHIIEVMQQHKKTQEAYYFKTAIHAAGCVLTVALKNEFGEALVEMNENRFGGWGKRKFRFIGGCMTFVSQQGGGYYVLKGDYLDGLRQGGDHPAEGPGDQPASEAHRVVRGPGEGQGMVREPDEDPGVIDLDETTDFF